MSAPLPVAPVALAAGDELPRETLGPLSRTDFVRYAGAGGDLNPIHHDEPLAQAAGMPSVFGMGLLHAGVLGNRLARWVGPESIRTLAYRFTGQVWPGDELTFTGKVERIEHDAGEPRAHIALRVERAPGEPVLTASAVVLVAA